MVTLEPESVPRAMLVTPVVLFWRALRPIAVLLSPVGVIKERVTPDSCVAPADGVISERTSAHGRVCSPSRTASKSVTPDSCVVAACGVVWNNVLDPFAVLPTPVVLPEALQRQLPCWTRRC